MTAWHGIQMVRDLNNDYLDPLKDVVPATRLGPTGRRAQGRLRDLPSGREQAAARRQPREGLSGTRRNAGEIRVSGNVLGVDATTFASTFSFDWRREPIFRRLAAGVSWLLVSRGERRAARTGGWNEHQGVADRQRRTRRGYPSRKRAEIPAYLEKVYWWTYVRPWAVRFFERQWLVNAILFGNYVRLRDMALEMMGAKLPGKTLQVACVYGDMTCRLAERVAAGGGQLDVVDVLPVQIENLRNKLPSDAPVRGLVQDSAALSFPDGRYDRAILFFLLHEQPEEWRRKTLSEAFRVVRPGGRIVIVDYAQPKWWRPFRYILPPALALLEPFALDLWRSDLQSFLRPSTSLRSLKRQTVFGGLYQAVVIER